MIDPDRERIYTYDTEGDELGYRLLYDGEYVSSVSKNAFTISTKGYSSKKKYDRECNTAN